MATQTEQEVESGARMIIALQGVADIEESMEEAKHGWLSMSESERQTTRQVYQMLFEKQL
jgi:hypothetical protein